MCALRFEKKRRLYNYNTNAHKISIASEKNVETRVHFTYNTRRDLILILNNNNNNNSLLLSSLLIYHHNNNNIIFPWSIARVNSNNAYPCTYIINVCNFLTRLYIYIYIFLGSHRTVHDVTPESFRYPRFP